MIEHQESMTAKLCSFARAMYSTDDYQCVYNDYLAHDLLGHNEYVSIADMIKKGRCPSICSQCNRECNLHETVSKFLAPIPVSREMFAADKFQDFLKDHSNSQYIICGAGMDTFSFRNQNTKVDIFEVDHPDTQRFKLNRIRKLKWNIASNVHFVPVDFSIQNMGSLLKENGFNPYKPAFFVIMGVSYYLTLEQINSLLDCIENIAWAPSAVILDYPTHLTSIHSERVSKLSEMTEKLGEKMTQGFELDDFIRIFENHHFHEIEHMDPNQIQDKYLNHRTDLKAYENIHFLYAKNQY